MPNYQYKCLDCPHTFEALLPAGHTQDVPCLECKSTNTQKLLTAPGVHFKGTGFYKTDSKEAGGQKKSEPEKNTDTN